MTEPDREFIKKLKKINEEIIGLRVRLANLYKLRKELRRVKVRPSAIERQAEVWRRACLGQTLDEIAIKTGQSLYTVKHHLQSELRDRTNSDNTQMVRLNFNLPPQSRLSLAVLCPFTWSRQRQGWMKEHLKLTDGKTK